MAKRKTQRSANCEANCDVGSEKPKRRRKSRKFTEKLQNVTFHPLRTMAAGGGGGGPRLPGQAGTGQDRTGQDRRAANRKTPFCSAACRLMRLQQMRRLPAVHHFCFIFSSLTHTYTHIDTDTYTKLESCVCVCGTHTATYPVAFDNSPQNVKNDEKLAPERSPSPHDVVFAYVLVMASVVLLFGGCHALLLSRSCTLSLSLSVALLCLSKYLCLCSSGQMPRCLTGFFLFRFFFWFVLRL